jgi:hypothetical protein
LVHAAIVGVQEDKFLAINAQVNEANRASNCSFYAPSASSELLRGVDSNEQIAPGAGFFGHQKTSSSSYEATESRAAES